MEADKKASDGKLVVTDVALEEANGMDGVMWISYTHNGHCAVMSEI